MCLRVFVVRQHLKDVDRGQEGKDQSLHRAGEQGQKHEGKVEGNPHRERLKRQHGDSVVAKRGGWLDDRRKSLQSRMRRRRKDRPGLLK